MPLDSYRIHEIPDDLFAALDYCYEQGWTDGLPVVPPVTARVDAMLGYFGYPHLWMSRAMSGKAEQSIIRRPRR